MKILTTIIKNGQKEVNNALPKKKRKKVSVIPDAIFLALLDMTNVKRLCLGAIHTSNNKI